jgi:selenocysteine lyase/cysteine desulfurase
VPNAYAALAALELLDRIGYDVVERQVRGLAERYASAARDEGFVVRTPDAPERRGPLVVVQSVDAPALVTKLAARGIIASCRGNGLRVSFHAYNNEPDVDAVVGALVAESALLERAPAAAR